MLRNVQTDRNWLFLGRAKTICKNSRQLSWEKSFSTGLFFSQLDKGKYSYSYLDVTGNYIIKTMIDDLASPTSVTVFTLLVTHVIEVTLHYNGNTFYKQV